MPREGETVEAPRSAFLARTGANKTRDSHALERRQEF